MNYFSYDDFTIEIQDMGGYFSYEIWRDGVKLNEGESDNENDAYDDCVNWIESVGCTL